MKDQKRVTIEGYFHLPSETIFDDVKFLTDEGGELTHQKDIAHILFKKFLTQEDLDKVLDWEKHIEDLAASGKLVVVVDYEPPYVVEWHHEDRTEMDWERSMQASVEDLHMFTTRFEHLIHMG